MADRIRVAVLYGGRSSEHSISVLSAGSVLAALDPQRYEAIPIGIDPDGRWLLTGAHADQLQLHGRELPAVRTGAPVALSPTGELVAVDGAAEALRGIEVVFPVLHGRWGEDGTVQGMLELAGVPYVGAGVFASAAGMDKQFSKVLLSAAGLDVGRYVVVRAAESVPVPAIHELGLPVFVKPARAGSSVGITKVTDWAGLRDAIDEALRHDEKALVEAAVVGREVECGVLAGPDGRPRASLPAEIRLRPGHEWYDFDAKYLDDAIDLDIPADLPPEVLAAVQDAACRAFSALDCAGLARVDFFVVDGRVVVNEINTMPGFTATSAFPKMWAATGVPYAEVVELLIRGALARAGRG